MAVINLQVNSGTDDARSTSTGASYNTNSSTHYVGIKGGVDYWIGNVWDNVTIPQGSTIDSAILSLYNADIGEGTTVEVEIVGHDVDSAATYSTGNRPSNVVDTTASVTDSFTVADFEAGGVGFSAYTWEVKTIVQEIVNRAGWSSGNSLAMVLRDNGSAAASNISFSTYDRAVDRGAKLDVTYTIASTRRIFNIS